MLFCKLCGRKTIHKYKSNYTRAIRGSGLCNGCSRRGIKRTDEQKNKIKEATKKAMNSDIVKSKIKTTLSNPNVKRKMSENGKKQMEKMLKTDKDRILWKWKISKGTKRKWLNRPHDEKQKIINQINNERKKFIIQLNDPIYKKNHVRKIVNAVKQKDTQPEKEMKVSLDLNGVKYIHPYQVEDKIYDFYLPDYKLLIEVDGTYWHGKGLTNNKMNNMQKKHKKNDKYKNNLASKLGFGLLRFWENEINPIIVSERIN
jgi:DNA mismatch endonuclease (patch repair protein)